MIGPPSAKWLGWGRGREFPQAFAEAVGSYRIADGARPSDADIPGILQRLGGR